MVLLSLHKLEETVDLYLQAAVLPAGLLAAVMVQKPLVAN